MIMSMLTTGAGNNEMENHPAEGVPVPRAPVVTEKEMSESV